MIPWVDDYPCLERHGRHGVRRSAETGSETTQRSRTRTYGRSGVGTRSALPGSMNADADETLCGTCGLPMYGAASCVVCDRDAAYKTAIDALVAPKGAYKVLLASVGNPDFGQDSRRSLPGVPRRTLRVASLANASKACRAYIAHYELGGGNWLGGEVQKDGKVIAQISYNGRAWEPGDWPTKEIPLTSEAAS